MKKILFMVLIASSFAICIPHDASAASGIVRLKEQKMEKKKLKEAANSAFLALFSDYSEEGVRKYIDSNIVQHNPYVPTGRDALIGFLPTLKKSGITYTNHRILQDGEFVVLHNSFTNAQAFGADKIVTFDIYRMKNGKAVEHWDAITPFVQKTASGRSQVDGETTIQIYIKQRLIKH
jgi:predicted SnoaL-like aldol condensation-catalyzing enzyme